MGTTESKAINGYRGDTFEVAVGDEVILIYNGHPEVPHYLSNTPAFVEGFTKTKVKVRPTQ